MKALIQRVSEAAVSIDEKINGEIEKGLLVFLGIDKTDTYKEADKLLAKVLAYRVFPDAKGKMNLSVQAAEGGVLLISQFTLSADTKKGSRPSFSSAAMPEQAEQLYHYFLQGLHSAHSPVAEGIFAADMQVSLVNDGPVTFLLEQ